MEIARNSQLWRGLCIPIVSFHFNDASLIVESSAASSDAFLYYCFLVSFLVFFFFWHNVCFCLRVATKSALTVPVSTCHCMIDINCNWDICSSVLGPFIFPHGSAWTFSGLQFLSTFPWDVLYSCNLHVYTVCNCIDSVSLLNNVMRT